MLIIDPDDYCCTIESGPDSESDTEFEDSESSDTSASDSDLEPIDICDISRHYYAEVFKLFQHFVLKKDVIGYTVVFDPITDTCINRQVLISEDYWENIYGNFVPLHVKGQPDLLHWPGYTQKSDHDKSSPFYVVKLRYFRQVLEQPERALRDRKVKQNRKRPGFRKLYTEKKRFICDPNLVCPENIHYTSSVLYPKVYKHSFPDKNLNQQHVHSDRKKFQRTVDKVLKFPVKSDVKLTLKEESDSDSDSCYSRYDDTEGSDTEYVSDESDTADLKSDIKPKQESDIEYDSDTADLKSDIKPKQDSDTESYAPSDYLDDTDHKMGIDSKSSALTPQMKMLLNTDVKNIISDANLKDDLQDFAKYIPTPKIKPVKQIIPSVERFNPYSRLSSLKRKLSTHKHRKKQIVNNISFLFNTVAKLEQEYSLLDRESSDITDEIYKRETFLTVGSKATGKLPRKVAMQMSSLCSELATINDKPHVKDPAQQSPSTSTSTLVQPSTSSIAVKSEPNDGGLAGGILPMVQPVHRCTLCGKEYTDKRSFSDHIAGHTQKTPIHKCEQCKTDRFFTNTQSFKNHMSFHKNGEVYLECKTCTKKFEHKAGLRIHQKVHETASLHCRVHPKETCQKVFTFQNERRNHELYSGQPKRFKCDTCEGRYSLPKTVRIHQLQQGHSGITKLW